MAGSYHGQDFGNGGGFGRALHAAARPVCDDAGRVHRANARLDRPRFSLTGIALLIWGGVIIRRRELEMHELPIRIRAPR